jgi:predicted metalloprotease with PDZ domain
MAFYRKPKPETMKKNRQLYSETYKDEIKWLGDNLDSIMKSKNKFLLDMYQILISGSRKITPKMESAIINGITRCKNNPLYNKELREEADDKLKPILSKINMVMAMAEAKNDKAVGFIKNVGVMVVIQ